MSLVAVLGALLLSTAAPEAARAAPTPGPTLAQPRPQQPPSAPGVPSPTAALQPTPAPMRAPGIVVSPSPVQATPPPAGTDPTPAPPASNEPTPSTAPGQAEPEPTIDEPVGDNPEQVEPPIDWQAFVPTDTADHLSTMDRAARDSGCGVPWHLLAAIARVESDFGRNMATSSAGAVGYGQFLPSSWQAFGNDGNVYDYRDALPAIATYLCQSGIERDPRAALFAYNHADWYVDLVLNLAVRYDRMAPGAPTPDVLEVGPLAESGTRLRYAPGRDVRRDTRRRTIDGQADWLGVPWRGRPTGASISAPVLEGTTIAMLRGAFGLPSQPSQPTEPADGLTVYADRAWDAGLLAAPIKPPVLLSGPDERRPIQNAQWSMAEIRRNLERGQPVVAMVATRLLPGHSQKEGHGDQPLVLIGKTPGGLVYSDASFSTSLGYGLELSDTEFLAAWQAASTPDQAMAVSVRPLPLPRDAHVHVAEPPPVYARVFPTPAPASPTPEVTQPAAAVFAQDPTPGPVLGAPTLAAEAAALPARASASETGPAWVLILLGAGASVLVAGLVTRSLRARRSSGP